MVARAYVNCKDGNMRAVKHSAHPTPHVGVIDLTARTYHFDHTILG
jgi:hypothetical protein